jgi:hypothetical protein
MGSWRSARGLGVPEGDVGLSTLSWPPGEAPVAKTCL